MGLDYERTLQVASFVGPSPLLARGADVIEKLATIAVWRARRVFDSSRG
jgi:hypothetical protein